MILFSLLQSSYRAWNQSLLKDYSINWDIYVSLYKITFKKFVKRIPLVMDDNEKDFKNGELLFEWLCSANDFTFHLTGEFFESLIYLSTYYPEE